MRPAHIDKYPSFVREESWTSFRKIGPWSSSGPSPVNDVRSEAIRCYQEVPFTAAPSTRAVQAGDSLNVTVESPSGDMYHPGAVFAYMVIDKPDSLYCCLPTLVDFVSS